MNTEAANLPDRASLRVAVLGLGSVLGTDDSVGVHVVRKLAEERLLAEGLDGTEIALIDAGTVSFPLLTTIAETDAVILVDAARMKSAPGTVGVYEGPAMDRYIATSPPSSVHEVSLAELLQAAALTDSLPGLRALVGVEPEITTLGLEPTPAVRAAITDACAAVRSIIEGWTHA